MTDEQQTFKGSIERQFELIQQKLDRLDEAIRGTPGNGTKPGILIRLDRLEQDARRQSQLIWMIVGAFVTSIASAVVMWIAKGAV